MGFIKLKERSIVDEIKCLRKCIFLSLLINFVAILAVFEFCYFVYGKLTLEILIWGATITFCFAVFCLIWLGLYGFNSFSSAEYDRMLKKHYALSIMISGMWSLGAFYLFPFESDFFLVFYLMMQFIVTSALYAICIGSLFTLIIVSILLCGSAITMEIAQKKELHFFDNIVMLIAFSVVSFRFLKSKKYSSLLNKSKSAEIRLGSISNHENSIPKIILSVVHDLRQPIHALELYLKSLNKYELPVSAELIIERAFVCVRSMSDISRSLLDFSKIELDVIKPDIKAFPISIVLERLLIEFEPLTMAKKQSLRIISCSCWVLSDSILLERMLSNFIANAIRHSDQGRILIGCRRTKTHLVIQVHDEGPGIPQNLHDRIFEYAFQGYRNTKLDGSLGLGLSIALKLAKILDASIVLKSGSGRGAMFGVEIPRLSTGIFMK